MDTYREVVREFLAAAEGRNLSANTVRMYWNSLNTFGKWLDSQGLTRVRDITTAHLREYVSGSLKEVSPGATHARLRPLKTMLRWCVDEEILEEDPMKRVRLPKIPEVKLQVVRPVVFRKLVAAAKTNLKPLRNVALISVLYDAGLRASELCELHLEDFQTAGYVVVRSGKGGKVRSVPISRDTVRAVRAYLHRERPETTVPNLFLISEDAPMTRNTLAKLLERLCQSAGVENYTAHAFRRGFVVEFVKRGGNVFAAQRILGHTTLHMSNRYARLDSEDLKAIHRRASPVQGNRKD